MTPDYTLYLVTDSTPAILGDRDLPSVVRAAVKGGVTVVQYRDKMSETVDLVRTARQLHEVTRAHNVPLLINDRVDVALAVGAEGVHVGQEDMDLASARKLLGPDAIVGVSVGNADEAKAATAGGASYISIGAVFATPTYASSCLSFPQPQLSNNNVKRVRKENTKSILGPPGVRAILSCLRGYSPSIPVICIGGLNFSNIPRVLYQSRTSLDDPALSGVAVVSAIVAAQDPGVAAKQLRAQINTPPAFARPRMADSVAGLGEAEAKRRCLVEDGRVKAEMVVDVLRRVAETTPICHNMTNLVVQNFAANVALCIGASPIMSTTATEAPDLAALNGSLVVNVGTVTPDALANYQQALAAYNEKGGPVVLDPVGAGATQLRRNALRTLLSAGYFDVIKGNEDEIKAVATTAGAGAGIDTAAAQQRGVDSGASTLSDAQKAELVRAVAARERNVCLMTGRHDFVSDGARTFKVRNGHKFLGAITGSGCTLGTTIAACLAVKRDDTLLATLAGVLMFEIAAEKAGARPDVTGPGSFVPAFLDALWTLQGMYELGKADWLDAAMVDVCDV
ncbi:hydroxyethylthiazole kinase [Lineolata rhizophorae]|uniref:Hydroxyethylthiazole kinase n=1 Tax=Lineolata rhizophorae TaxID=578093 RepID=A0A6A6NX87_9PEZI|nr:hydroxyethylthiazole kinase [Lineolata rhizophorae]